MQSLRLALVILASSLAGTSHAGDYVPPDVLATLPNLPAGSDTAQVLRLDLAEALTIAMRENLGIALERKVARAASLNVTAATGVMYEPTITAGVRHSGENTPPSTIQAGQPGAIITSTSDAWNVSASQRLPTGAQLSVGLTNSRVASSAGTAIEPLSYNSVLSFSVLQPVLRGFSTDLAIPQYAILTAKIASEQERHQLAITAATLVQQTEAAYWDVVLALYSYGVTVKSKQLAQDTMTLVQRQISAGVVPPSDLTGAQNTFAQREVAVITAAQSVEQAWDALRTVINLPRDQWSHPILPTDRPHFSAAIVAAPEAAFETAMHRRPEVAQADLELETATLATRKASNDRLPQIDVGVTGAAYGQDPTYRGALGDLGSHQATGWSVLVDLTWTPLLRASTANAELARIQHEIRIVNREQRLQGIWNEVRAAVRNQRAAALQVVAASESRTLATESLEIETRKYMTGASSNLNIATLQTGLANAELTELQALLGHEKARTALLLATGQLLEERHIELVTVRRSQ